MLLYSTSCSTESKPRQVFISYSHQQKEWRDQIVSVLKPLEESRQITAWHDRRLLPGNQWDGVIKQELERSEIILLLVGNAFLQSGYCNDVEVQLAVHRANLGEAILIPFITEPCDWHQAPFARFQCLPSDNTTLSDYPDNQALLEECRDSVAAACIGQWLPRMKDAKPSDGFGIWQVDFRNRNNGAADIPSLIMKMRKLTGESDINYIGVFSKNGQSKDTEIKTLVLEGIPMAFTKLRNLHREQKLSAELDVEILNLDIKLGASFYSGFNDAVNFNQLSKECVGVIHTTQPYLPLRMMGFAVRPSDPSWFMALPHVGDSQLSAENLKNAQQKVIAYFYTSLGVPGEDMHVNLSPYDENRIIPASLIKAPLGQVLVEQDCLLKHFTASLLHPDTDTGKAFWAEVYQTIRSHKTFQLSSHNIFQRVWIVPGNAVIEQKEPGKPFPIRLPPGFEVLPDDWGAIITNCHLKVQAETDYFAFQNKNPGRNRQDEGLNTLFLEIFKSIVLPVIEQEINTGSHFAPLRQVYCSVILAKWYRETLAQPGIHTSLLDLGKRIYLEVLNGDKNYTPSSYTGINNNSPDWLVKCFARYRQLYENGVFRCLKSELSDSAEKPTMKIYFSGEIDFRNLRDII
jgi:hypothetical protein